MKLSNFLMVFIFLATPYYAHAGNPGISAQECVSTKEEEATIWFENNCGQAVFVMYCGELAYDSRTCHSSPSGRFFTHTKNLASGQRDYIKLKKGGSYRFGACIGKAGFGADGWEEKSNGRYDCTRTGK